MVINDNLFINHCHISGVERGEQAAARRDSAPALVPHHGTVISESRNLRTTRSVFKSAFSSRSSNTHQ
jgi:hypothetical protein